MRRVGRFIKRILRAAIGLALLVFLVMVALNTVWHMRTEHELEAIRAQGYPVTTEDLIQPYVPDEENGALIYGQAMDLLPAADSTEWHSICDFSSKDKRQQNPGLWPEVRDVPERYSKIISLIEEATQKPECQFQADWNGPMIITPDKSARRSLSQLLACVSLVSAREGRMDQVVRCTELGIGLSRSYDDEPSLVSQLLANAVLNINSAAMRQALACGDLSQEQALKLYEAIATVDLNKALKQTLAAERIRCRWMMSTWYRSMAYMPLMVDRDLFDMDLPPEALWQPTADVLGLKGVERVRWKIWEEMYARCIRTGDAQAWLSFMRRQLEGVDMPYTEARSHGLFATNPDVPSYAVASRGMSGLYGGVHGSRFRTQTVLAMDQTLLLLMAHKARHGDYPDSLDKVGFQADVPRDPYSGERFRYNKLPEGFVLYSVGPDLNDDGGMESDKYLRDPLDKGDVVLRWR